MIPFVLVTLLVPHKLASKKISKYLAYTFYTLATIILVYTAFAEYFFWDEFNVKFNFIAVDYLIYTNEVLGNIWESYNIPMLLDQKMGLMVWSPLAGGLLSGKYSLNAETKEGRRVSFDFPPVNKEKVYHVIDVMRAIATAKQVTVAQVALAWLLHQPAVTSVIIGANKPQQLTDNLGSVAVQLNIDELATLDEVSKLAPEYPGWMIERQSSDRR